MTTPLENLDEIRDVARAVLRKAATGERLPTPVDDIVAACGLVESSDYVLSESKIRQAPRELRRFLRTATRKIRGVLDRRERIIHVNPSVDVPAQRQFVRCHEAMHDALPWQRDLIVLGDTSRTLAADIELMFEREANQGGAELLFQLDLLARVASDYPTDITTPIALAGLFGASIHATFRRWIETNARAVCGLVLDPEPLSVAPLTFRRYELIESPSWSRQHGPNPFPVRITSTTHAFVAPLGPPWPGQVDTQWRLDNTNGDRTVVRVQSFCNTYRTFVLLWPPAKERLVPRHRVRPKIEAA